MVIIFLNIQQSSVPFLKLKANEVAENALHEAIEYHNFTDEEFKREEFFVRKTVSTHDFLRDCFNLRILVFDTERKKITELSQLVYGGK